MLAQVQPDPVEELPLPTVLRFKAEFDPTKPQAEQFSFFDENNNHHNNLFAIGESREVVITLENATFSDQAPDKGIHWRMSPDEPPVLNVDSQTRTFEVPAPAHVFHPWAFQLVVDTPDVKGIRSPTIYIAKRIDPADLNLLETLILNFNPASGAFHLQNEGEGNMVSVGAQQLLVFAIPPGETLSIGFILENTSTMDVTLGWAQSPIVWTSGSKPEWVVTPTVAADGTMTMMIDSSGTGHIAGFQFAVQVTPPGGTTITVLSPDPVIVNATIGDG